MLVVAKTNYFQINNLTLDICLLSKRGITLVPHHLPGHFSVLVGYLSHNIYPRSQICLNILIFSLLAPNISNHNTRGGTLLMVSRLQLIVLIHFKKSDGNIIILKHGDFVSVSYPFSIILSRWPPKLYNFTPTIHPTRSWGIWGTPFTHEAPPPPPGPQRPPRCNNEPKT